MPFGFSPDLVAALSIGLLGAAYVRGYSGFGFSALFIAWASLWTNPLPLIPVVFGCEILMTAFQARGIAGHVEWRRVGALWLGAAVALPFATTVILALSDTGVRLAVSLIVLVMSGILLSGWTLQQRIGVPGHAAVGVLSGTINAAGVGGLPVAAFLTAQPVAAAVFRATMIVYLTGLDIMTLPWFWHGGLVTEQTLWALLLAFPLIGLGVWLGGRRFTSASPEGFRRFAIILLFTLASLGILRAIFFSG